MLSSNHEIHNSIPARSKFRRPRRRKLRSSEELGNSFLLGLFQFRPLHCHPQWLNVEAQNLLIETVGAARLLPVTLNAPGLARATGESILDGVVVVGRARSDLVLHIGSCAGLCASVYSCSCTSPARPKPFRDPGYDIGIGYRGLGGEAVSWGLFVRRSGCRCVWAHCVGGLDWAQGISDDSWGFRVVE